MSLIQHCYGKIGYLDAVNLTIMLEKFVSSKSNTIKRWALQYGTNSSNSMERHDLPAHKLSKLLKIYALLNMDSSEQSPKFYCKEGGAV